MENMNKKLNRLYLLSQTDNSGYCTYKEVVVCAPDEYTAVRMHPSNTFEYREDQGWFINSTYPVPDKSWAYTHKSVECQLIGVAAVDTEIGVICADFTAE